MESGVLKNLFGSFSTPAIHWLLMVLSPRTTKLFTRGSLVVSCHILAQRKGRDKVPPTIAQTSPFHYREKQSIGIYDTRYISALKFSCIMKVFLHYEDNENKDLHKSLKITLPKSWKTGPTSRLLSQFVESYNASETLGSLNPLQEDDLHMAIRKSEGDGDATPLVPLASDAVTIEVIPDREDVYILHGPSQTVQQIEDASKAEDERRKQELESTASCTHFGCKNRFPKGGPYPACQYHKAPPVFHETAKFWSCCPNKKAYDWNDFENIPGCMTGVCTDVKEEQKTFLGGSDLREKAGEAAKLKSIDDFNKSHAAGGSDAAPVLDGLRTVLVQLGVENELFDQVVDGMTKELTGTVSSEAELLEAVAAELGGKLKAAMKAIAAEQQRIK